MGFILILFIFYKISEVIYNYLIDKNKKITMHAGIIRGYIRGIPIFIFLFRGNFKPFVLYNLLILYGLCCIDNIFYLNDYLCDKIKYPKWVSIVVIYAPIILIMLSIINSLNKTIIIIEYIGIVLLCVTHVFINFKLSNK